MPAERPGIVAGLAPAGIPSTSIAAPAGFVVTEREPVPGNGDCDDYDNCGYTVELFCAGTCPVVPCGNPGGLHDGGFTYGD